MIAAVAGVVKENAMANLERTVREGFCDCTKGKKVDIKE